MGDAMERAKEGRWKDAMKVQWGRVTYHRHPLAALLLFFFSCPCLYLPLPPRVSLSLSAYVVFLGLVHNL